MKKVYLSVQDFAYPSPRTGSIEFNSGYATGLNALQKGTELHLEIQKERQMGHANYKSEVRVSHEFTIGDYLICVEGRMDGLFEKEIHHIEEIKSSFNIFELKRLLREKWMDHPYTLQLMTYGYLHFLKTNQKPTLSFYLASSRNHETDELDCHFDVKLYERWLERRLKELLEEIKRVEKRSIRRKGLGEIIPFPFATPRRGQKELISFIEEGFKDSHHLMIQAPTGLGKTIGVLYPSMREALLRGQQTIYLTPKNSQQRVAEEAIEKFQENGCQVKSLTLTAKSKMCLKAEPLCNPDYCEFAKDHYDKVHQHGLKDQLLKKKKLTAKIIKNMAEKYVVCPFELQKDAVDEADAVIGDYNHVFSSRSSLTKDQILKVEDIGKPNLVVDEAHNLPSRAMSFYSPSISTGVLEKMKEEMKSLPKKFSSDGIELVSEAISVIQDHKPTSGKNEKIAPRIIPIILLEEELKNFLNRYLASDVEIKNKDVVLRFVFYWSEFIEVLKQLVDSKRPEFFVSYYSDYSGASIKITCCDASEMIKPKYEHFDQVVAFSATLKPFDYYSKLSGLESEKLKMSEFTSPFSVEQRKVMIIPQISTKFSSREWNYPKIAETIIKIMELKVGNYVAFFPSFDFLEKTANHLRSQNKFKFIKQTRTMKNDDVSSVIESLKEKTPTLLFAVQGGHFSEGVDYPGDMLIGAFVVGPPLPNFDFERENIKSYYQDFYQQGFDYAYTFPAMAKAVQSAGRVIRTEQDRGIIILMDNRFLEKNYFQSMPRDWFESSPQELVSQSILHDLKNFWDKTL